MEALSLIPRAILWVALFLGAAAASAQDLARGAIPAWAEMVAAPLPGPRTSAFVDHGFEVLLSDTQINLRPRGHVRFVRQVTKIHDRIALETVGNVQLDFDPASEAMTLHHLKVLRGEAEIDHSGLAFTALRRETGLHAGIIDGKITLTAHIPDLRPGDVLDLAYSAEVTPAIFPEHFHDVFRLDPRPASTPPRLEQHVVIAPSTMTLGRTREPSAIVRDGDVVRLIWRLAEPQKDTSDRHYALWSERYDPVQVSSFASWEAISAGIAPNYAPARLDDLPTELQNFVASTMTDYGSAEERATQALRLVQSRVRYVGIEIGAGGYIPRAPALVWSRGYGDCKDKALLLVTLLKAMQIEAEVALVNSVRTRAVGRGLPSPFVFDHAIVRLPDDEGPYFLDPTNLLQGGIGRHIALPDFGVALPLVNGGATLVPVPRAEPGLPDFEVQDTYDFAQEGNTAATLTVVTTFRNAEADGKRAKFQSKPLADTRESHLDWYQKRYPGASEIAPMQMQDDIDSNTVTLTASYRLTNDGFRDKGRWKNFYLNPYTVKNELEPLEDVETDPLDFPYEPWFTGRQRHQITLTGLPDPLKPPPDLVHVGRYVAFTRTGEQKSGGDEISVTYDLSMRQSHIAPGDGETYSEEVAIVGENDDWRYTLLWRSPGVGFSKTALIGPITVGHTFGGLAVLFAGLMFAVGVARGMRSG